MISTARPTTYQSSLICAGCSWVPGLASQQPSSPSWPSWGPPSSTGSSSPTSSSAQSPSYTVRLSSRIIVALLLYKDHFQITMWDATKLIKKEYIVLKMRQQTLLVNIWSFFSINTDLYDLLELSSNYTTTESEFDKIWGQYSTVPLFLILILFPLVNLKSATFFTKFNALGKSQAVQQILYFKLF